MNNLKDKTVEELLEIVGDLQDRLTELEGGGPKFKAGDIVRAVKSTAHPSKGDYCRITRGDHVYMGESGWVDYITQDGWRDGCRSRVFELVWRD